jgi:hypothetical protein
MAPQIPSTPETLMEYPVPLLGDDREAYRARACGRERVDGTWEGWLEFESADGRSVWRTGRETTQPNRTDAIYWATGITQVYLQGALARAMEPPPHVAVATPSPPAFDGPAEDVVTTAEWSTAPTPSEAILDPFAAYAKGEAVLRRQLGALEAWHLRTIAQAYRMVASAAAADNLGKPELIDVIVAHVRDVGVAGRGPTASR